MTSPRLTLIALIAAVLPFLFVLQGSHADDTKLAANPETLRFGEFQMKLARIKPGTFTMGSPASEQDHDPTEPQHQVTLTKSFWIGATPVTRAQFKQFVDDTGYRTSAEKSGRSAAYTATGLKLLPALTWKTPSNDPDESDLPVVHVSDEDAIAFCQWASARSGKKVRLPTEAEWEYACRAATATPFAGDLNEMGWYAGNSGDEPLDCDALLQRGRAVFLKAIFDNHCRPHPVGRKRPNAWGLYDAHGNVWQWCSDAYTDYPPGPAVDPTGPEIAKPKWRSARGGDYANYPAIARSANRGYWAPGQSYGMIGFRVVVE
jgi:formylglycine-generating enzyme required for sulfatase activity